jgi:RNA polymerase sigma factor (sigma-70 family)
VAQTTTWLTRGVRGDTITWLSMDRREHTGPGEVPHKLGQSPHLADLLALVRDVVRQLAQQRMGPALAAREAPSDLAQTVVLEILQHADRIEDRGAASTRALAKTVLVRKLADRVRAARAGKRGGAAAAQELVTDDGSRPGVPLPAAPGPSPAASAADRDLMQHVNNLLDRLTARERAVFELRLAGKAHAEIAAALGISVDYSQRLLADARSKLRAAIPGED